MESQGKIFGVYTVKDELTGRFLQPIFIETEPEAIRWFKFVLNHTEMWKDNAAMYSLYKVSEFNDMTGEMKNIKPEMIQGGLAMIGKEN